MLMQPLYRGQSQGERYRTAGFSIIEVVISVGILMALTIAIASMLRNGFDIKQGLSERAQVMHRLSVAMAKLATDVEHTFFVSMKDQKRNGIGRTTKAIFKTEKSIKGDRLLLTTKTHQPLVRGAHEGDTSFVVYELRESKTATGRTDLYRGDYKVIPESFREDPPMRLLAPHIKSMTIEPWLGDGWGRDGWDTERGEFRDKIPHMVRITLEAWALGRKDGDGQSEQADQQVEKLVTVVYLAEAPNYEEIKQQNSSIKWSAF